MKAKYKRRLTSSPFISVDLIKTPFVKKSELLKKFTLDIRSLRNP